MVRTMNMADRIKQRRNELELSQRKLADLVGISQPAVAKIEKGAETAHVVDIARALGVTPEWLVYGQDRQEKFMGAAEVVDPSALTSPAPVQGVGAQPNPPHERDYALIPQYHVSGECGSGYLNGHEEVKGGLAFKRDWLARMSLKPDSLSVIYACGLSMAPTISEGEVLLVDHGQSEPRDGQVFAFERDGELLIKRLVRHPAGSWICRSDNPDKIRYADWEPVSTEQLGLLRIVGRIVWRGGAM